LKGKSSIWIAQNVERKLLRALGVFIAMSPHDELTYRRALLLHQPDGNAEDMIVQSGIFTLRHGVYSGAAGEVAPFRHANAWF
jgi:hypothetical protein